MKIKKRIEERNEGFPIKDRKEVKREKKQFSINEGKKKDKALAHTTNKLCVKKKERESNQRKCVLM